MTIDQDQRRRNDGTDRPVGSPAANKQTVLDLIETVWRRGELNRLADFWTPDCINHAASPGSETGLAALARYHEQFGPFFAGLSDIAITMLQQIGDGDRVVTHVQLKARHTGVFMSIAATMRMISLVTIRIDRFEAGRIAEHWSVADLAGLMQQITGTETIVRDE